jgi:hypothetical protein
MCKVLVLLIGFSATIVPASARIAGEDALKICRDHIRQDASARFGSTNIVFRNTNLNESEDAYDRVSGTFLATGNGSSGIHKFDCSVDVDNGNVRWARIDSRNAEPSATPAIPTTPAGGAGYTDAELMDMCRTAVRSKIYDHGYIRTKFNTLSVEKSEGPTYLVSGTAMGEAGGHEAVYGFSCRGNWGTGAVESVELKAR